MIEAPLTCDNHKINVGQLNILHMYLPIILRRDPPARESSVPYKEVIGETTCVLPPFIPALSLLFSLPPVSLR